MQFAHDDYQLRSRWGHVPRTPRAGPRPNRAEFAAVPRPPASRGWPLQGMLARLGDRPQRRGASGELDIHAYLELEFAVDDERTATH